MTSHSGNQSVDSDKQIITARLLQWMNAQSVLLQLIVEAKKQWYHSQGHHLNSTLNDSKISDNDEFYNQIGHTIKMERFGYGQSNPTYRISVLLVVDTYMSSISINKVKCDDNNNNNDNNNDNERQHNPEHQQELITFVLRSKPKSVIHASAHAIHREYAILSAIHRYNQEVRMESANHPSPDYLIHAWIVPVPKVYVYCHDTSIIGTSFYVMEFMNGRICTDPSLQDQFDTPYERQQAYQHVVHVLALIHLIDLSPYMDYNMLLHGGEQNFHTNTSTRDTQINIAKSKWKDINTSRKKMNFVERQLLQLTHVSKRQSIALEQLVNSSTPPTFGKHDTTGIRHDVSKMMHQLDPIIEGLQKYAPYCIGSPQNNITGTLLIQPQHTNNQSVVSSTSSTKTATTTEKGTMLIHGDYKIDNIIFHPTLPKAIAVIDWELASIHHDGVDPYCDVANLCMMYFIPKPEATTTATTSNDSNTTVITGIANYTNPFIQSLGIPLRKELIQMYCNERDHILLTLNSCPFRNIQSSLIYHDSALVYQWSGFYLTFLFFKNCIILQGVLQRTMQLESNMVEINKRKEAKVNAHQQQLHGKTKLLLYLLPITINLTTDIWKRYPPPSLDHLAQFITSRM